MSSLICLINSLCAELRSDKPATRNKAAEQLENHLSTSKNELFAKLQKQDRDNVSWTTIFNSAIDATIKHAIKLEECKDGKNQAMLNKNYVYSAIVNKLINYNLEESEHLFTKSTLYNAFQDGFKSRVAVLYFNDLFLSILVQGLFKSSQYVQELKVNEYSLILSYLFETNKGTDDLFRFSSLKAITKTIELSHDHVQMSADVIDYFPEIYEFANKASKDGQKADVIKLFYLMVSQHSVDYHNTICNGLQKILPLITGFYQYNMKLETKEILFKSVLISLQTLYPYMQQGDTTTINITVDVSWSKTLRKLKTLVEMEIKERKSSQYQLSRSHQNDKSLEAFVKMSALVMYLVIWQMESGSSENMDEEQPVSKSKISRTADKLEVILDFVQAFSSKYNDIWLSILAEIANEIDNIINIANYEQLLNATASILQHYTNAKNMRSVRFLLTKLLYKEKEFLATRSIPCNYCQDAWLKVVQLLISDTSSCPDVISEKQIILQKLIAHDKLSIDHCSTVISSFLTNAGLRRSECVVTLQDIFKNADSIGLDKTSIVVSQCITWLYGDKDRNEAKSILLNVEPINPNLIAETCAIAVINFLSDKTLRQFTPKKVDVNNNLQYLRFKYIRKFLCLEYHGQKLKSFSKESNGEVAVSSNCLFQNNYEFLMRCLNLDTTQGTTCKDILEDLTSLQKMSLLMKALLEYGVFDDNSFIQCPLIKRIGLFLSHLELQVKNNAPNTIERATLGEIINLLENIFICFTSNITLLQYLERQPIEEMIEFLGLSLKLCAKNCRDESDFDDWGAVSIKILCLLANLCASSSHFKDAFAHISRFNFNIKTQTSIILDLTKIFCLQKAKYRDVGMWFVNKLKTIFKLYHANIEIMNKILEIIPAIFVYIQRYDDCLDDMLLAMSSLFKIAFRKSYSVKITAKIITCICYIVRDCSNIYVQENFRNLCLSVVNFLPFASLEVQYAAINSITALMDINWLGSTKCDVDLYYDFCDSIYETIKWKQLQVFAAQAESPDQLQNSKSLNVQLLVALLAFSCFHRENALQELSHVCALYKFTEADLNELHRIGEFYETDIKALVKPNIPSAIHWWISKSYPILKFPFFLCFKTKNEFVEDNMETIITCLLMYNKSEELQKLQNYGDTQNLLKTAMPVINAFILINQCPESHNNELKTYVKNILKLKLDFTRAKNDTYTWKVVFTLFDVLRDDSDSKAIAGFPIFFQTTKWYNINCKCLKSTLNVYINNRTDDVKPEVLLNYVTKHPLRLVKTFGALKKNCSSCIYPIDSLKQFYKFYTLADMVLDTLSHTSIPANLSYYFLRDIYFYCLHCLESASLECLRKLILNAIERINGKLSNFKNINNFMEKHLRDISKSLLYMHKISLCQEEQQKLCTICDYLITTYKEAIVDKQYMLTIFSNSEKFLNIRKIIESITDHKENEGDNWQTFLELFLENTNYSLDTFKMVQKHISQYKRELQMESNLLYRLVRHLLQIVRQTQNNVLNLEALKCLGEIGALNLKYMAYYFEADDFPIEESDKTDRNIEGFFHSIYKILEKLLNTFNAFTHSYVVEVAQYLVNSKYGQDLIDEFPYFIVFRANVLKNYMDTYDSIPLADWLGTLKSCDAFEYEHFVCEFVSKIYAHCNWKQFYDLASSDIYFAEQSIIPFMRLLLQCDQGQAHKDNVIAMLEYFFDNFLEEEPKGSYLGWNKIYKDKRIVKLFLNICECVRINNLWHLPLKLLNVVRACNYCQAYFLSIIYLEMWALEEKAMGEKKDVEIASMDLFQELARKAYDSIGCNDAISGFINPLNSRMDYLNLTNNWWDILIESNNSSTSSSDYNNLCNAVLKRNGMLHLASSNACASNSMDYEICWRLCRWDTSVEGHSKVNTLNDMEYEYEKHHFNALKCMFHKEENNTLAAIEKSRHCVLNILKEVSVECLQSLYKYLTWLQLLQQSEDFCLVQFSKSPDVTHIFNKWHIESHDLEYGVFSNKELILSHQISLFQTAGIRANRKIKEFYMDNPIEKCLLKCIRDCKAAGEINLATRYIAVLKNLCVNNDNPQLQISALIEDVDICMRTGKSEMTKSILHHIFMHKEYKCCLQRIKAMQLNGKYLMDTNAEMFETVLKKYFMGSLDLLDKYDKSKGTILQRYPNLFTLEEFKDCQQESKRNAYEIIAKYSDREYNQLNLYANSDQFKMKRKIMEFNKQAAQAIQTGNPRIQDRDKHICANFMKRTSNMDEQEITLIEQKLTFYLCTAVENYLKFVCLDMVISSPVIYRIIGLWFANKQNDTLRATIQNNVTDVPSYKFICALNQMTARLNSKNVEFIKILKEIMVRCTVEHPHQTLYQLYPIVYGHIDGTQNKTDYRSKMAQEIIARAKSKINANIVKQLESAIPALIDFANTEIKDHKLTTIALSEKLKRLKNLNAIHCPTIDLPVRIDQNYNVISIVKWESQVGLVGGINAPKKLACVCSDGITRPQLLKGKDDLRQDAVMQQVFCMINNLLKQEPEAVQRKLLIRTYKVVPLSTRSGILEWCQNTVPLGVYLMGAHQKYRPNDFPVSRCRKMAMDNLKSVAEKRYETHLHICEKIKPVFHYFFFEKFLRPGIWFERRLAYINSVATTSMVGYILGLGDRHTQNILIDQKTAEVIHIDFGIAFEQGKVMPTPETVPFRLTRDILAPMGISGSNGVFKKSCETTISILRRHQDVITTILEVLLYDPLYIWKVVPQVADDNDNSANEEKNYIAQRALIVVQNKLEGKQNAIFGTSSVAVQVERLINDAVNVRNLCMLYPGWDPYL
ncbi:serine/threonine-protein kinase ATM [Stomoxys calcitrans]|uniref:serine/threonine-protein kinase ATM n=1 Tax=Stomoxys calcitrans TaxID=35570 RepID=UPI0027E36B5C|nr:serine/threonine-protein kinase ATM [Stomoxys calcitrans]